MVKTPWIIKKIFNKLVWDIPSTEKVLYLTFDDGPHLEATTFVLDELRRYGAKASFFCLGKNVVAHPDIYRQILSEGHLTGNHTFNHLNGWKVDDQAYFTDVLEAEKFIESYLFRPPYGKITPFQVKHLSNAPLNFKIIMWDVLSKDYDVSLTHEDCTFNVVRYSKPGSIIVFHDSEKAFPRLKQTLPAILKYFSDKGYRFDSINGLGTPLIQKEEDLGGL